MPKQLNVNLAFTADTSQAKKQIQDLFNSLNNVQTKTPRVMDDTQLRKAAQAAQELQHHLSAALDVDTGKIDLSKFSASLSRSNKDLDKYRQELTAIGPEGQQAFLKVAQAIMNSEKSLSWAQKKANEFLVTLKNTARWQISSSILHGLQGAIQSAFYYAQDLDKSLNNIQIVTGQNADQMARFAEQANAAAKALSTTTTAYTDAALIYYQQGLNDEQVKARTDVTVKLANVTGTNAQAVSEQMTAIWNNFDDGSKSLEHYADVLTALGATTASSSAEIAGGMQQFAASAETVGLSYEYAASALATVVAATRQSENVVGNAFKTLFSRLEGLNLGETLDDGTTLNKYSAALEKVGISIKDQYGNMKAMDDILNELGAKWNTLARDQQMALAQTVGGVRQYTQLIALMDNWGEFQKNLQTANTSDGSLQKQADIYAESWEAAKKRVQAELEDIYSTLINPQKLTKVVNFGADLLKVINGILKGLGGVPGILSMAMAYVTQLMAKNMPGYIQKISTGLQSIKTSITDIFKKKTPGEMAGGQKPEDALKAYTQSFLDTEASKADVETDAVYAVQIQKLQQISQLKTDLANKASTLSDAEKEAYAVEIQQLEAHYDLIEAKAQSVKKAKEENDLLKEQIKSTVLKYQNKQAEKEGREIKTSITDEEAINEAIQSYEVLNANIKIVKDTQASMINQVKDWATNTPQSVDVVKDSVQKYINSLENADINLKELAKRSATFRELQAVMEDTNATAEDVMNAFAKAFGTNNQGAMRTISAMLKETNVDANELAQTLHAQGITPELLVKLAKEAGIADEKVEEVKKSLEELQQKAKNTKDSNVHFKNMSQDIMNVGSALMNVSGMINTFQSIVSTWSNKSTSNITKITTTISGMGSALMNTMMIVSQLSKLGIGFAGPIGAAIAGISIAIGVVTGLMQRAEQKSQEAIESAQKEFEKIQQINEAHKQEIELLKEIDKYQSGNNQEYITQLEKLIQTYNIQDGYLLLIRGDYEAIEKAAYAAAKAEIEAAAAAARKTQTTTETYIQDTNWWKSLNGKSGTYSMSTVKPEQQEGFNLLKELGYISTSENGLEYTIDFKNLNIEDLETVYSFLKDSGSTQWSHAKEGLGEFLQSNEWKTWQDSFSAANQQDITAKFINPNDITNLKEFNSIYQELINTGHKESDILNIASQYSPEKAAQYSGFVSAMKEIGIESSDELFNSALDYFDSLSDEDKNVYLKLKLDQDSLLNASNEIATWRKQNQAFTVQEDTDKLVNAKDTYKSGMRGAELLAWKESSGIDWDNLKGEVQSFNDFLALTESKRNEWLDSQIEQSQQKMGQAIAQDINLLAQESNKLQEERNKIQSEVKTELELDSLYEKFQNSDDNWEEFLNNNRAQIDAIKEVLNLSSDDEFYERMEQASETMKDNAQELLDLGNQISEKESEIAAKREEMQIEYDINAQSAETFEELNTLLAEGAINSEAFSKRFLTLKEQLLDEDIEETAFKDMSKYLKENAKDVAGLSKQLTVNKKAAEAVAKAILRYDSAIQKVTDHYDEWVEALESGNEYEQAEALKEIRNNFNDILDMPFDTLSDEFVNSRENLDLMKEAAEGNEEAYNDLLAAANQDILTTVGLDDVDFQTKYADIKGKVDAGLQDIQAGAYIDDSQAIQAMNELINSADMTAQQATDLLASMGVDAEVEQVDVPANSEYAGADASITYDYAESPDLLVGGTTTTSIPVPNITYTATPEVVPGEMTATALRVKSARKASGGGIKQNLAPSGGGGGSKGGGGGGGSKPKHQTVKHVSTQKTANLKTGDQSGERYHVINNQIEDLAKQYDRLSEAEERAFGKSKLALMDQQVNLLNQQYKAQRKLREEAEKYWKEDMENLVNGQLDTTGDGKIDTLGAKAYLGKDVQFDKNGTILNYDELINAADERYNKLTNSYNDFIGKYNEAIAARNTAIDKYNGMSAEEQETIKDQWQAESEQWDAEAEKWEAQKETWDARHEEEENYYNNFMGLIDQYEDTQDKVQQELNKEIEAYHATLDKLLEKTEYHVQLKIDISNDALKLIDFLQKTVYSSEWQAAKNIESAGQKFDLSLNNIATQREGLAEMFQHHFDVDHVFDNSNADVGSNEFLKAMHDLGYKSGEEIVNGLQAGDQKLKNALGNMENEFTEKEVADWRKGLDEILKETENLWQQREDVFSYMDKYIDASNQKLDDMASHMDHLANVTSKYKDIVDLVGHNKGGFDTEAIKAVTAAQQALRQDAVKSAKARNDLAQSELEAAKASKQAAIENGVTSERDLELWDKEIQKLQERADSTKEELLEDLHAVLQGAADQFKETIQLMAEDMSKAMAGAAGSLEGLSQQMSQYEKTHSTMVPEYERVYQLNKLNAAAIKAIDETNNIRAKEQLLEYQKQILEAQESGREMSQWELSNLEKELALRQAALAVEEATSVKSQVRMSRDNEGNYSYIYTADESAVGDAEANYRDKLYEMQKANSDYINQLQNDIVSLESEYLNAIQEAADMYGIGSDEYYTALDRINEWYNQAVTEKYDELNRVMDANQELQEFDTNFHARMTGDKQVSDEGYVKTFEQTVLSQLTGYKNAEDAMGTWKDTVDTFSTEANDDINSVRNLVGEYESTNREAMSNAGIEIDDNKGTWEGFAKYLTGEDGKTGALGDIITESNELAEKIKALGEEYGNQINNVIMPSVVDWETKYSNMIEKQVADNTKLGESINEVILKLSGLDKLIKDIKAESPINIEVNVPEVDPIHVEVIYDDPGFTPVQPEPITVGSGDSGGGGGGGGGSYTNYDDDDDEPVKTQAPGWKYNDAKHWREYTDGTTVPGTAENHIHGPSLSNDVEWMCTVCYYSKRKIAQAVADKGSGSNSKKLNTAKAYATGGYTGDWGSEEGKIAILHEKELVLNDQDTKNMLTAVNLVRQISQAIDLNAASASSAFSAMFAGQVSMGNQALEQDVHITAEFPNATDRNEILAAFDNVINLASQYANRKVPTANKQTTKF